MLGRLLTVHYPVNSNWLMVIDESVRSGHLSRSDCGGKMFVVVAPQVQVSGLSKVNDLRKCANNRKRFENRERAFIAQNHGH